jgi:hypothetical protein
MPQIQVEVRDLLVTKTNQVEAESSSEAASLKGKRAMTPLIAGSVIGGLMAIAWIVGFTLYFIKRSKHKKRKRLIEAGLARPKPKKAHSLPEPKYIIPPDPAILLGQREPGDNAFNGDKHSDHSNQHLAPNKSLSEPLVLKVDSNSAGAHHGSPPSEIPMAKTDSMAWSNAETAGTTDETNSR